MTTTVAAAAVTTTTTTATKIQHHQHKRALNSIIGKKPEKQMVKHNNNNRKQHRSLHIFVQYNALYTHLNGIHNGTSVCMAEKEIHKNRSDNKIIRKFHWPDVFRVGVFILINNVYDIVCTLHICISFSASV